MHFSVELYKTKNLIKGFYLILYLECKYMLEMKKLNKGLNILIIIEK